MFKNLRADIRAAKQNDPAARSKFEIWLTYSGVKALAWHRFAHFLYKIKLRLLARSVSQFARWITGIEIHPAAKIAGGVFIDHGAGVVIGETAEIEEGVIIYQGVTLGGTGKQTGKRHPTVKRGAMISAASKMEYLSGYPNFWIPPGICITLAILAFNFVGDGLRDAFDPKMKR